MNETTEKELRKVLNELYELLKEGNITSIIYLPSVKHFSITGKVGEQIVFIGLMLAKICDVTGKNIKEILDKDFYDYMFPECVKFIKEDKKLERGIV